MANMTPLTAEQAELAAAHLAVVRRVARPYKLLWRGREDAEFDSAGNLALVQAARSFDPSRGRPFGPYAAFRVRGAMLDTVRNIIRSSMPAKGGNVADTTWDRLVSHGRPVGAEIEDKDELDSLLVRIGNRRAGICRDRYLEGKTYRQIAEERGLARSYAYKLVEGGHGVEGALSLLRRAARPSP